MKKNVILLVTTLFFIITMCGAVSATENTTGGANDSYVPVSISGKVLDCVTNQPFANVTVKATNNGQEMAENHHR